jgi:hypothetical protein
MIQTRRDSLAAAPVGAPLLPQHAAAAPHLEHALEYAARGWRLLPVWPMVNGRCACGNDCGDAAGKHPVFTTGEGHEGASIDPKVLAGWFGGDKPLNIAIRTGDGLAVLDVDPRNGGAESLAKAVAAHGPLPATRIAETGRGDGGIHVYLKVPHGTASRKIAPGLDLQAEGKYVIAPPSNHASGGTYRWHPLQPPLARAPAWVLGPPPARHKARPPQHWEAVIRSGAARGERNDTLAALAGYLFRLPIDGGVAWELALAWNRGSNRPPLSEREAERTLASIAHREAARRRGEAA